MAIPEIFQGSTPTIENGGLTPLQLALADQLTAGTSPPLGINNDFLVELKKFADSAPVGPSNFPNTDGIAILSDSDHVYLLRNAQDCGPDETGRVERVYLGTKTQLNLAFSSFEFYGQQVQSGSGVNGSLGGSSTGPGFL